MNTRCSRWCVGTTLVALLMLAGCDGGDEPESDAEGRGSVTLVPDANPPGPGGADPGVPGTGGGEDLQGMGVAGGADGYSLRFSFVTSFGAGSVKPNTVISTYRAMSANVRFSAIFKPCSSTTAFASA